MDGGIMVSNTADGINHGKSILTDCFCAVVEKFEDGYMLCPILWSGGKCDECLEAFERRQT
jgi:hypothetical protein